MIKYIYRDEPEILTCLYMFTAAASAARNSNYCAAYMIMMPERPVPSAAGKTPRDFWRRCSAKSPGESPAVSVLPLEHPAAETVGFYLLKRYSPCI
jgi:hypothetical protein